MNLHLKVSKAFLAGLVRWSYGGASWRAMVLNSRKALKLAGHSFSVIWKMGFMPVLRRVV